MPLFETRAAESREIERKLHASTSNGKNIGYKTREGRKRNKFSIRYRDEHHVATSLAYNFIPCRIIARRNCRRRKILRDTSKPFSHYGEPCLLSYRIVLQRKREREREREKKMEGDSQLVMDAYIYVYVLPHMYYFLILS